MTVVAYDVPSVYEMVAIPAVVPVNVPVTMPLEAPMVATDTSLLLHVPPGVVLARVTVAPAHTVEGPVIGPMAKAAKDVKKASIVNKCFMRWFLVINNASHRSLLREKNGIANIPHVMCNFSRQEHFAW